MYNGHELNCLPPLSICKNTKSVTFISHHDIVCLRELRDDPGRGGGCAKAYRCAGEHHRSAIGTVLGRVCWCRRS